MDDIRVDTSLHGAKLDFAKLNVSFDILPPISKSSDFSVRACLKDAKGVTIREETSEAEATEFDWSLEQGAVQSWWPIGYGEQPLYTLEICLCRKVSIAQAQC